MPLPRVMMYTSAVSIGRKIRPTIQAAFPKPLTVSSRNRSVITWNITNRYAMNRKAEKISQTESQKLLIDFPLV
jgi:hypothetical protein